MTIKPTCTELALMTTGDVMTRTLDVESPKVIESPTCQKQTPLFSSYLNGFLDLARPRLFISVSRAVSSLCDDFSLKFIESRPRSRHGIGIECLVHDRGTV